MTTETYNRIKWLKALDEASDLLHNRLMPLTPGYSLEAPQLCAKIDELTDEINKYFERLGIQFTLEQEIDRGPKR